MNPASPSEPTSIQEVLVRAKSLTGRSVRWLLDTLMASEDSRAAQIARQRHKGQVGRAVEWWLGARDTVFAGPDFPALKLEVKTLPVTDAMVPRESTFLTYASTYSQSPLRWEESVVFKKLETVLWIVIYLPATHAGLADRYFLDPVLWQPSAAQWQSLRSDWESLTQMLYLGERTLLTGHFGEVLQLRPKAYNSHCKRAFLNDQGEWSNEVPQGFYLRAAFTRHILQTREGVVPTVGVEPTTY